MHGRRVSNHGLTASPLLPHGRPLPGLAFHLPPRHAELVVQLELPPELLAGELPAQQGTVTGDGGGHFFR